MDDDLRRLIARRLEELNLKPHAAAARARDAGHKITNQRLSQLTNEEISQVPYPATLLALACALDVPVEEVADAALRSIGVPIPVRVNGHGEQASIRIGKPGSRPRSSEHGELALVLRVEGLSPETLRSLIQTVAETALREGQQIAQSGQPDVDAARI